ncbi:hypothetical protein Y032_0516g2802 [Ancylostoma ceylanicum]|uniref:Uncharacterized protein n=1 Tax=Ancylostoma ceylanicum TaxID=53326 RepID=A0A016WUW2_9BILA|nr:hypothetical protein Y032_0516g2802 [Ancylostoma ceylanicum]
MKLGIVYKKKTADSCWVWRRFASSVDIVDHPFFHRISGCRSDGDRAARPFPAELESADFFMDSISLLQLVVKSLRKIVSECKVSNRGYSPANCTFVRGFAPRYARFTFAFRPSMIGFGSLQARSAAARSFIVT